MNVILMVLGLGCYALFGACLVCACFMAFTRNERRIKERQGWR